MSQWLRVFVAGSFVAVAALWACNSSPTSESSGQAGSNRIAGTFLSGTATASRLTARASSTYDGITVSDKRDSSLRVEVRSNGTFILDQVPGGTVTLVFTRDGANLGEITIGAVGSDETVRVLLELTGNDRVALIEVQRASEDHRSEDGDLELELDPDHWCPESAVVSDSDDDSGDDDSADDDSEDEDDGEDQGDLVFATIKGSSIQDVDLSSIRMAGPGGEVPPSSAELKSDRIEVIFDKSVALEAVSGVAQGQRTTIQIEGSYQDGTSWQLSASVRVTCDDDVSDDDSSG